MKKFLLLLALAWVGCAPDRTAPPDLGTWEAYAKNVNIVRDDWGIPHIRGKTDADAVFGMMYAQAEDDFNRIEVNYLTALGRMAEAEGENRIWQDLRARMFNDPEELKRLYTESPPWLKALMDAWAAGLNYYLYTHPETRPKVLTRFEPWMALSFTEGSIGGDIERINLRQLRAFYEGVEEGTEPEGVQVAAGPPDGRRAAAWAGLAPRGPSVLASAAAGADLWGDLGDGLDPEALRELSGSNGIAIAPSNTADGKTLLLINPHTSFFFRHEAQVTSEEGLNVYGASTWGQFFVYQGFNEKVGWMHTSSGVDNIDEYLETVVQRGDSVFYRYGSEERPMAMRKVTITYKTDTGTAEREFTIYRTHRGPIVRKEGDKWVSVALMEKPVEALTQSFTRTKARNYQEFRAAMELHTNSSNNTVFADAEGNIAYFHANFVPVRDTRFDWNRPVDGTDPATDWKGVHSLDESPNVLNPPNGWIQNTNNWPWSAAGPYSPKREDYPAYFETARENYRGIHAVMVLENRKDFTLDALVEAAYDPFLPAFADILPPLIRAFDALPTGDPLKNKLAEPVELLRGWDLRWGVDSEATSLAIYWGEEVLQRVRRDAAAARMTDFEYVKAGRAGRGALESLAAAVDRLTEDFGSWRVPWGEINRFQRLTGDIVQEFKDDAPSTPVGFTSGNWGSLASFQARTYPGTKRRYGTSGNSFVAVVEFGDSVRARAVTAGGLSNDPASPHFNDQAERYATGNLREVYFYPHQLQGHIVREYRPGRKK